MFIDTSRFYVNPWIGLHNEMPVSLFSPQQQDKYVEVARHLLETCIRNYEVTKSTNQQEPSSSHNNHHRRPQHQELPSYSAKQELLLKDQELGTLYTGGLGPLVYLRWRLSMTLRERNPKEADQLVNHALLTVEQCLRQEQDTRTTTNTESNRRRSRRVTLLEGSYFGVRSMYATLLFSTGQMDKAIDQANEVIHSLQVSCESFLRHDENEVLYGRAGSLTVILFLRRVFHDDTLGSHVALQLASDIIREGKAMAATRPELGLPLLWMWHNSLYLGAARGIVGILQTLLSLNAVEMQTLGNSNIHLIRDTLDALEKFCMPSGNLHSSVKDEKGTNPNSMDRLVHWCHGAPGHVILLVKAYEVFQDEKYKIQAQRIATNVIWPRGLLQKGVGLCHGISGNAYALLAVGRVDESFMSKVECFTEFALEKLNDLIMIPDHPYSLFEGIGGFCSLIIDLTLPMNEVRFPLYEF